MLHGIVAQGTTPTQIFELPFEASLLEKVSITYAQNGEILFRKYFRDCYIEKNYLIVELSEQETLLFSSKSKAEVQLKVLTKSGKVFASPQYSLGIEEVLDREEMKR